MWLFYVKACYPGPEKWYRRNDTDMASNSNRTPPQKSIFLSNEILVRSKMTSAETLLLQGFDLFSVSFKLGERT